MAASILSLVLVLWCAGSTSATRAARKSETQTTIKSYRIVSESGRQAIPQHAVGVQVHGFADENKLDKEAIDMVHQYGLKTFTGPSGSESASPKVAFIFLTYEGLALPGIWDAYFADAPQNQFSIYVHEASLLDKNETSRNTQPIPLVQFGATRIPTVKSSWCAIFGLEVHALATAMNSDAANTQFIISSGSSLPMKSFSYLHDQLVVKSPKTSKVCLASATQGSTPNSEQAAHPNDPTCAFSDFLQKYDSRTMKTHNWMVISREHATTIVNSAILGLNQFKETHQKSPRDVQALAGCSDEYGPLTTLLADYKQAGKSSEDPRADLKAMGVEFHCTTLALWRACVRNTPISTSWGHSKSSGLLSNLLQRMMGGKNVSAEDDGDFPHQFDQVDYHYLEHIVTKERFLFARKFKSSSKVLMDGTSKELQDVLPALWKMPGDPSRESRVWPTLDILGRPVEEGAGEAAAV
mmetsp:Transcript_64792/g.140612  ORF Transcript_64792/g.140612 Transcript_64792/m.140612 type:complete len:467 (+) Transcript_64792:171-1571(+)